ncbi:hypothetical protein TARUN_7654 [Trichoderma arundinaceum]|uniref:Uncharacterized protein n=1 Tax=Trichoderma arundinaceum TaxID=490622 RepID=A0A395NF61_TRIAR|nr:hypothetical protein TARUN_7654 [Trichoderma arundinaceum]
MLADAGFILHTECLSDRTAGLAARALQCPLPIKGRHRADLQDTEADGQFAALTAPRIASQPVKRTQPLACGHGAEQKTKQTGDATMSSHPTDCPPVHHPSPWEPLLGDGLARAERFQLLIAPLPPEMSYMSSAACIEREMLSILGLACSLSRLLPSVNLRGQSTESARAQVSETETPPPLPSLRSQSYQPGPDRPKSTCWRRGPYR